MDTTGWAMIQLVFCGFFLWDAPKMKTSVLTGAGRGAGYTTASLSFRLRETQQFRQLKLHDRFMTRFHELRAHHPMIACLTVITALPFMAGFGDRGVDERG